VVVDFRNLSAGAEQLSKEQVLLTASSSGGELLARQIAFIIEIDKLKQVLRHSPLIDRSRRENDAEHSWHLATMALVLNDHAGPDVSLVRVLKMLLIHDIVEVDAGDTFLYDTEAAAEQAAREAVAAQRLFGLLPPGVGAELCALWEEFEEQRSPDSLWARTLDRLQPLLQNYCTEGGNWRYPGVTPEKVLARLDVIREASPSLWQFAERLVRDGAARGYFRKEAPAGLMLPRIQSGMPEL
jgi:putative hydrolase of HD superfamily